MALLVFPPNPYNGEIYPVNPPAGVNVYQWSSADQTWRLLGTATGVVPGTYGSPTRIPVFEVDVVGRLVEASQVPIAVATTSSTGVIQVGSNLEITGAGILSVPFASTTQAGVVELIDNTTDCSPNKALSGVVGCQLQAEIDALKAKTYLTFAGTVNASTGLMTTVTVKGAAAGFAVGAPMVTPSPANIEYLVIVSQPGTFAPPNSLTYNCTVGDWLVSNGLQWIFYNVGPEAAVLVQLDDISGGFNGSQKTFPLSISGVPYTPTGQTNILISLGGVLQMPGLAFTVSGSTLTFADPPLAGTTFLSYVISGATGGGGGGGVGSVTSVATGNGLTGGPITTTGTVSLKVATSLSLGGVIPDGTTITVTPGGVISLAPQYNLTMVPVPFGTSSPGAVGQIAFGGNFFYWYNGAQWLRVAGSAF